jgi:hypothetical protein
MNRFEGSAALAMLLVAGALGRTHAQASDFDARQAAARAALVKGLEGYAEWCQGKSLFQARQKACELLLVLEPEHAEAHKALGHTRAKDGTWKVPEKPKAPRDFDRQALAEAPEHWREATAGYLTAMVGLLEAGTLSAEQKQAAARAAFLVDPENERVHVLLGEVKTDKGWVLPETARAKERRQEMLEAVRKAFEQAPAVEAAELSAREQAIPLKLVAFAAPGLRVVGTTGEEELRRAAQAVLALEVFVQTVFESTYALPKDLTVFLFSDPSQRAAFVASHPAIPAAERGQYEKLEGGGIQGTNDFAFWTGDTQRRIDGIVRLVLGFWLSGAFEIGVRQGWAYEGFGLFLTRSLVRSRLTWLAQASTVVSGTADMALRQKLLEPETNWPDEALRMLLEKRTPPLAELFKKDASALTTEDVLYSYILATYLLEAHPEVIAKMLKRLGTGYPGISAFREALEMDAATFELHLERWLKERV